MSNDVVAVISLLASFAMLQLMAGGMVEQLSQFMRACITAGSEPVGEAGSAALGLARQGSGVMLRVVGPIVGVCALSAIVATLAQTKLLVTGELLKPKLSRISPLQGFKRLFSLRSISETMKCLLKISILLVIIYNCIQGMFQESAKYLYTDVPSASVHLFDQMMSMIWSIAIAFAILAAADYFYQRWDYERQMRMSKQEIKEEFKQVEGNPQIKGKIRDIQRQMARSRMMQQVPQADVVTRNPTHVAVALRYKPETDSAPVVLAMGLDELALRIVKVAEENKVAVIENVSLARALYQSGELNREIPPELYGAVAEVLVYIFRLNDKKQIVK